VKKSGSQTEQLDPEINCYFRFNYEVCKKRNNSKSVSKNLATLSLHIQKIQ